MTAGLSGVGFLPAHFAALKRVQTLWLILTVALLTSTSIAQQSAQPTTVPSPQTDVQPSSPEPVQAPAPDPKKSVTVPAGTRLALVLTHPIDGKSMHRGDEIFAETSAPVTADNAVVIPAGTFVQGKVQKLTRQGSRGEILMQSLTVAFPNGYVVSISGPINMESDEGTAWNNPSAGTKAGMFAAPVVGLGLGLGIGAAAHTTQSSSLGGTTITSSSPKGLAIGGTVGLAAGAAVSLILLARSHHFYVEEGSPADMTLPQPLTLAQAQISDAVSKAAANPAPSSVTAKRSPTLKPASADHGTCYIPGRPGTPGTYIPGTPPMGASPGTPGTFIPGEPPTPPIPYPCP